MSGANQDRDRSAHPSPSGVLTPSSDETKETSNDETGDVRERSTQTEESKGDLQFRGLKDGENESEG